MISLLLQFSATQEFAAETKYTIDKAVLRMLRLFTTNPVRHFRLKVGRGFYKLVNHYNTDNILIPYTTHNTTRQSRFNQIKSAYQDLQAAMAEDDDPELEALEEAQAMAGRHGRATTMQQINANESVPVPVNGDFSVTSCASACRH